MKKAMIILAALALAACARTAEPEGTGTGTLRLALTQNIGIVDVTKSQVSDYTAVPSKDDFTITITNYAGATVWKGKFSEWDSELKLTEGDYSVVAEYGSTDEEGPGKPCFTGSEAFTITAFETTPVDVTVSPANAILKIKLGEYFQKYFKSYNFQITTGLGNKFALEQGQSVFIDAFKFTLDGSCTTTGGKNIVFSKEYANLDAATCYTICIDTDNVGGNSITINFNDNVENINIDEDLN